MPSLQLQRDLLHSAYSAFSWLTSQVKLLQHHHHPSTAAFICTHGCTTLASLSSTAAEAGASPTAYDAAEPAIHDGAASSALLAASTNHL